MFADLHLHTRFSDGTLNPDEIVEKTKTFGIELISTCDHNTVDAYPLLFELCTANKIQLLPGVEIDCFMGGRYVHLLGYGFDMNNSQFLEMIADCKEKMQYQNDIVIVNMAHEYSINLDEYTAYVSPPEIGGYKNSNFLLHKGIIKAIPEFFSLHKKYGVNMKDVGLPQLKNVCQVIKNAGGFPVLAHPWSRLDKDNFITELQMAVDSGAEGLECYYPDHDEKITTVCIDFCKKQNLFVTAGSDDHGLFNRVIDGITYEIGEIMVDTEKLNLKGFV